MSHLLESRASTARSRRAAQATAAPRRAPAAVLRLGALALLATAVVGAGGWALLTPRDTSPAALHERVDVDEGWMRVDNVLDVDLSTPMTGPGMAMGTSSGVPEIPDGTRRIDVEVTLAASGSAGLRFDPDTFTADTALSAPGRPVAADDTSDLVPPDGSLTRTLSFQVPAEAEVVTFRQDGGERPIEVPLGQAPTNHDH